VFEVRRTSPRVRLLNVVYAPRRPTFRNRRRVGPMRRAASARVVRRARENAPVRLIRRMS
jgi:hypothetical protein